MTLKRAFSYLVHSIAFVASSKYRALYRRLKIEVPILERKIEAVQRIDAALDPNGKYNHKQRRVIKAKIKKAIKKGKTNELQKLAQTA